MKSIRRRQLRWLALATACALAGCGGSPASDAGIGPQSDGGYCPTEFWWGLDFGRLYPWTTWTTEERIDRAVADMQELGVGWMHTWLAWNLVQPSIDETDLRVEDVTDGMVESYAFSSPDNDWSLYDAIIDRFEQADIQMLMSVGSGWSSGLPTTPGPVGDPVLLTADLVGIDNYLGLVYLHVRGTVRRYAGRVAVWQMENEINVAPETVLFGWREGNAWSDPDFVDSLVEVIHDAIRAEDSSAMTTINFHTDLYPLDDVLLQVDHWLPYLDVIGLDVLPNYLSGDPILSDVAAERVAATVVRFSSHPTIVVETGYPSGPADRSFSEEGQAEYWTEASRAVFLSGGSGFFPVLLTTEEELGTAIGVQEVENYWGLYRSDLTRKPAFDAYRSVIAEESARCTK